MIRHRLLHLYAAALILAAASSSAHAQFVPPGIANTATEQLADGLYTFRYGAYRSLFMVTPGQSGNTFSSHARDFVMRWRDGATITLGPTAASIGGTVHLIP